MLDRHTEKHVAYLTFKPCISYPGGTSFHGGGSGPYKWTLWLQGKLGRITIPDAKMYPNLTLIRQKCRKSHSVPHAQAFSVPSTSRLVDVGPSLLWLWEKVRLAADLDNGQHTQCSMDKNTLWCCSRIRTMVTQRFQNTSSLLLTPSTSHAA
ncbi:hypothetical protein BDZ94DRAFT_1277928 [Collybia nuda]|uniref:Uncharacterized protein n=1 Tax=Collybia nuda TaxID=64659 RepID=A0A9P5XRH3_9AGAR|nr:hypothetical protein BDZ94DRAFT_1277928 [Collybia nuda]